MTKSKILLSLALCVSLSSAQEDSRVNEFGANSNDKSFIADSELTKDLYKRGDSYNIELGIKSIHKVVDPETGLVTLRDDNGEIITFGEKTNQHTQEYIDSIKSFYKIDSGREVYRDGLDENNEFSKFNQLSDVEKTQVKEARALRLATAKLSRNLEMESKGHNQANNEEIFLRGLSANGKGQKTVNRFLKKKGVLKDSSGRFLQDDTNMTDFLKDNFGYDPEKNSNARIAASDVESLKKAQDVMLRVTDIAKSNLESSQIECFITRDLVEAYYCPLPTLNQVLFPDFLHGDVTKDNAKQYSSEKSKNACDTTCKTFQGCRSMEVIDRLEEDFGNYSNVEIYPNKTENNIFTLEVEDKVQTSMIYFDVKIIKSEEFEGNDEEFESYLSKQGLELKLNFSLFKRPTSESVTSEAISEHESRVLKHGLSRFSIPVYRQTDRFILQFFTPYIYRGDVSEVDRRGEREFLRNIGEIRIINIKAKYKSDKVYFCPQRQIITDASECDVADTLHISEGNQNYTICLDSKHKIGDDMRTGGFFSEGACESACYEQKECKTTYKHYSDLTQRRIFKTTVGCVDSPRNVGCEDQMCESLFQEPEIDPVSEITINSKDERIFTVQNFLPTKVDRPKIDIAGEYAAESDSDFENLFKKEMKDNAYKAMIKEQSFTRLKYKVGEDSPERRAVKIFNQGLGSGYMGRIKFKSSAYDNDSPTYVYSIMELDMQYKLKYGEYLLKDKDGDVVILNAKEKPIIINEKSYLTKKNDGTWEVFKKVFMDKVKINIPHIKCPSGASVNQRISRDGNLTIQQKRAGCVIQTEVVWKTLSDYSKDKFVKYIGGDTNGLVEFSPSEIAPYIDDQEITSESEIKDYLLTESIESTVRVTAGATVRGQRTDDGGRSSTNIYDMTKTLIGDEMSQILNYKFYLFSEDEKLSYETIINDKLDDKSLIYEKQNPRAMKFKIKDDSELNNGIKAFLLGDSDKHSVIMDVKPKFGEEGKRVFQFLFLFNERESLNDRFLAN